MIIHLLVMAAGLGILLISGDLLVKGAVAMARTARVDPLIVGLTVVAFGTSAPELLIGVKAALIGGEAAGLAIGNVVGSNIANVLLVLGLPALLCPTCCRLPAIRRNALIMMGATLLFMAACLNPGLTLTRFEGAILFLVLIAYLVYTARRAGSEQDDGLADDLTGEIEGMKGLPVSKVAVALTLLSACVGLPLGATLIVDSGIEIAGALGIPPSVVGLSLVAIGTSLPELATTVMAAVHRHSGVALGNVIGSNLFNLLGIMGLTGMISPAPLPIEDRFVQVDLWVLLASTLLVAGYTLGHKTIGRVSGIVFLIAYAAFMGFLFEAPGGKP